jgi:hypothetical protein
MHRDSLPPRLKFACFQRSAVIVASPCTIEAEWRFFIPTSRKFFI